MTANWEKKTPTACIMQKSHYQFLRHPFQAPRAWLHLPKPTPLSARSDLNDVSVIPVTKMCFTPALASVNPVGIVDPDAKFTTPPRIAIGSIDH